MADSPFLQSLQGADYFRYVAANDPDPAKRKGALDWLARNAPSTTGTVTPAIFPRATAPTSTTPTQKPFNQAAAEYMQNDPRFAGMDVNAIINAYDTGNWSGIKTSAGQPVSSAEADAEFKKQMAVLDPAFQAEKQKETLDLSSKLGSEQAGYQNYLDTAASNFQSEKSSQDKTAADNGVLFSSGRVQKLNNLASKYSSDAALKRSQYGSDVSGAARDYAYKYGSGAAGASPLSSYYSVGTNNYNPFVAKGGTSTGGLSSVYAPTEGFYGTNPALQSSQAKTRASGVLASKYNKLLPNSYQNQF